MFIFKYVCSCGRSKLLKNTFQRRDYIVKCSNHVGFGWMDYEYCFETEDKTIIDKAIQVEH